MNKWQEAFSIAGVMAGAGTLGGLLAFGVAQIYQTWLMEFIRLQGTLLALQRW